MFFIFFGEEEEREMHLRTTRANLCLGEQLFFLNVGFDIISAVGYKLNYQKLFWWRD